MHPRDTIPDASIYKENQQSALTFYPELKTQYLALFGSIHLGVGRRALISKFRFGSHLYNASPPLPFWSH